MSLEPCNLSTLIIPDFSLSKSLAPPACLSLVYAKVACAACDLVNAKVTCALCDWCMQRSDVCHVTCKCKGSTCDMQMQRSHVLCMQSSHVLRGTCGPWPAAAVHKQARLAQGCHSRWSRSLLWCSTKCCSSSGSSSRADQMLGPSLPLLQPCQ